jgi:hypothetical protein
MAVVVVVVGDVDVVVVACVRVDVGCQQKLCQGQKNIDWRLKILKFQCLKMGVNNLYVVRKSDSSKRMPNERDTEK